MSNEHPLAPLFRGNVTEDDHTWDAQSSPASRCSLDGVVREFVRLLDIEEESDSGRRFRPNGITSCRAMDGAKMVELIQEMKRLTENHPDKQP